MKALVLVCALCAAFDDLDEFEDGLRDADPKERRQAVIGLAKLDTPDAWELLIEKALSDLEPQVSDEAQFLLGGCADPDALKLLAGRAGVKARQELVRLRVYECLGRLPQDVDAALLLTGLGEKDPRARRAALWSVERLARRARLVGDVERKLLPKVTRAFEKDKDDEVAAAALSALVALQPDAEHWRTALDDGRTAVRVAAVEAGAASLDVLELLADDGAPAVRARVVECAIAREDKGGVTLLAARLAAEVETRLVWRSVGALREQSGLKHGRDSKPWIDWARALPADWQPVRPPRAPRRKRDEPDASTSAALAGLPVLSGRVAILIDMSGSMWATRRGKRTRKERVDEELRKALEALPAGARFNVIPYAHEPQPWRPALVPANERNVAAALEDFERLTLKGKGNVWDAFEAALADPDVDTLMLLSDGAPSGGHRWDLELMNLLFAERNRYRCVALDVLLIDQRDRLREYWQTMSAGSGGRLHPVDL